MVLLKTPESFSSVSGKHKNICYCILLSATLLGVSGCGMSPFSKDSPTEPSKARVEKLKTDINADSLSKPMAAQNGAQPERPVLKPLFEEKLRSEDARLARLEAAVQSLRDEFDTVKPSITRLMSAESDIQQLVIQLNELVKSNGGAGVDDDIQVSQLENDPNAINRAIGYTPPADTAAMSAPSATTPQTDALSPADQIEQPVARITRLEPSPNANGAPLQIAPPPPAIEPAGQAPGAYPPPAMPPLDDGAGGRRALAAPPIEQPPAPVAPPVAMPTPEPAAAPATAVAPPPATGALQLAALRVADSAGKTRIVMETTGKMGFTSDLDNTENILTLLFPAGTSIDVSALTLRSGLIKSVTQTPQANGGFILAFTLTHGSSILNKGEIAPNADNPHHRLWIDLKR